MSEEDKSKPAPKPLVSHEGDVEEALKAFDASTSSVKAYGSKLEPKTIDHDPELKALGGPGYQDTRKSVTDPDYGGPLAGGTKAQPYMTEEDWLSQGIARGNDYRPFGHPMDKEMGDILGSQSLQASGAAQSGDMGGGIAATQSTPAIPPVSPQQAQQWDGLKLGQQSPGGWRRTVSPGTAELGEDAFDQLGSANMQDIGYAKQGERGANAIRLAARDKAEAVMADQIGQAEGQFFQAQTELKKAQDIKAKADQESDEALRQVRESKIDPNHFFTSRDTITNIGLALSVAMGSYWSTVAGGPNEAMQIVDKAIDRDIRAQEVNMANKRASADSALRKNLQVTGDMNRAKELTRLQMLEATRLQSAKLAMDNQSAVEAANHERVMSSLEGSINKSRAAVAMEYAKYRQNTEQFVQPQNQVLAFIKEGKANYENFIPGIGIVSEKVYPKAAEESGNLAYFQTIMYKVAKAAGDVSTLKRAGGLTEATKSEKLRELEALFQEARAMKSKALEQGVIRKEEAGIYDTLVGSPDSFWQSPEASQRLVTKIAENANSQLAAKRIQYHGIPAKIVQAQTPTGIIYMAMPLPSTDESANQDAFNKPDLGDIQKPQMKPMTGQR